MKKPIHRKEYFKMISNHFNVHKVCALLGPRQCGKTTLAALFARKYKIPKENIFDLENPFDLSRISDPILSISGLKGIVVIDEIQRKPNLFSEIRFIVDKYNIKFLILGSASRELIKQSSQSLAGRIGYIEMTPFSILEVKDDEKLWIRGGFPNSYFAKTEDLSALWRKNYIKTFLETDIPNLGFSINASQIRKFWYMLCHYHGCIFNATEIGNAIGVSYHTVQNYLSILQGTFMVRVLQPWYENTKKRQVKTPKIYFRDSGIYHTILGVNNKSDILLNPKIGASWEGFAMEEIIKYYDIDQNDCYFWSSHNESELDLVIFKEGKRIGFEFKYTSTPKITKSMHIAIETLKLNELNIIFPGDMRYTLSEKIYVVGLKCIK